MNIIEEKDWCWECGDTLTQEEETNNDHICNDCLREEESKEQTE